MSSLRPASVASGGGSYSSGRWVRLIQAVRKPKAAAPMMSQRFDETKTASPGAILKRSVTIRFYVDPTTGSETALGAFKLVSCLASPYVPFA